MRKVKYIETNYSITRYGIEIILLTYGTVYDVIRSMEHHMPSGQTIFVRNNVGEVAEYLYQGFFEDVTAEYRNNLIHEILL